MSRSQEMVHKLSEAHNQKSATVREKQDGVADRENAGMGVIQWARAEYRGGVLRVQQIPTRLHELRMVVVSGFGLGLVLVCDWQVESNSSNRHASAVTCSRCFPYYESCERQDGIRENGSCDVVRISGTLTMDTIAGMRWPNR